jgi:tRNA A37 threonylcarbamoyladenosine synthetase subunit TsaC/SUA5/YrdC
LTFIAKANLNKLPLVVTAGTGFVGLRSPKHPIARKLI